MFQWGLHVSSAPGSIRGQSPSIARAFIDSVGITLQTSYKYVAKQKKIFFD